MTADVKTESRSNSEAESEFEVRVISYSGIMKGSDVQLVTGLSRVTLWREERAGRFPARVQLTGNRVGWYGNEVQNWMKSRPRVNLTPCEFGGVE